MPTPNSNANNDNNAEYYQLWLPFLDETDPQQGSMFRFIFKTTPSPAFSACFSIDLNPQLATPPANTFSGEPSFIYNFDAKTNACILTKANATFGAYFIEGSINIVELSYKNGQFDNETKNFFFNLNIGTQVEPQGIAGLFALSLWEPTIPETPASPENPDNTGMTENTATTENTGTVENTDTTDNTGTIDNTDTTEDREITEEASTTEDKGTIVVNTTTTKKSKNNK